MSIRIVIHLNPLKNVFAIKDNESLDKYTRLKESKDTRQINAVFNFDLNLKG